MADPSAERSGVVRLLATAIGLVGVLALAGWIAHVPVLTGAGAGWVTLKPNSALCLVAVAVGLWGLTCRDSVRWRRAVPALGGLVIAVAGLTFVEHLFGVDLHIDQLLHTVRESSSSPGRMSPLTGLALLLLGLGLIASPSTRRWLVQVCGIAAFAIGYVALLGYLYGASSLYAFRGHGGVSLPAALAVAFGALALLAAHPAEGLMSLAAKRDDVGRLVRTMLPFLLLGGATLGSLDLAGRRRGLYDEALGAAAATLILVTLGTGLVWWAAVQISRLTSNLQARVDALAENSSDAVLTVAEDGLILGANTHVADLFGYAPEDLLGQHVELLLPERLRSVHEDHRSRFGQQPQLRPMVAQADVPARRVDGSEFPVEVSLSPVPAGDRQLVLATVRDISERRQAQNLLREAARRFTAAFDDAPVGMALVSPEGRLQQVNRALCRMLGYQAEELTGRLLTELTDPRDIAAGDPVSDLLAGRLRGYQQEQRWIDADGAPVWVLVSASAVRESDDAPAYLVMHVEDARERKQYEGRLQYLADHDPLTGLFNRRRFDQELNRHLAEHERYGGAGAVLILDLDNFKYVNDTLGHGVGDALIRAVAGGLRQRLRDSDVLARLGGDEFAVLLPTAGAIQAQTVATSLLEAIRSEGHVMDGRWKARTTVSIGMTMLDDPSGRTAEEVLAAADLAMYAAKEDGRDRFALFSPGGVYQAKTEARFRWLDRIHTALENDLFVLEAQPILELDRGVITHYELLLRMREDEQLVPPEFFLYVAERHGLGRAIDRWVIRTAVELAAGQPGQHLPRLEVNLSADSLGDPELPAFLAALLEEHGVAPCRFVFEVTETAAIANMDVARGFVERVTALGCSFALDDFGAGFGSFYYLKHLPFDYLKIDGEFVRNLPASTTDQLIVRSIVAAARGLGKKIVAEYVGDPATVDLLRDYGVDYAQGYHIGRPRSLTATGLAVRPPKPRGEVEQPLEQFRRG